MDAPHDLQRHLVRPELVRPLRFVSPPHAGHMTFFILQLNGKPIVECALEGEERYPIQGGSADAVVFPSSIGLALERVEGPVKGASREAKGISVVVDPAARTAARTAVVGGGYACCLYSKSGVAAAKAIMLEARRAGCTLRDAVEEGLDPDGLRHCACLIAFLDKAFLRDVSLTWILARKYQAGGDVAVCALEDVESAALPEKLAGLDKEHWLVYSHGMKADLNAQLARHLQRLGCRDASTLPGFEYEQVEKGIVIARYTGMDPSPRIETSYGGVPVVEIADRAFEGCVHLESLSIPEGVARIGDGAFEGCTSLVSVFIPDGVAEIGESAFSCCDALVSVSIPKGVADIGSWAFYGCSALASVAIPGSVTRIGDGAFKGCASLASVSIPEGVTEIGKEVFADCERLTVRCSRDSYAWRYCTVFGIPVEPKSTQP